MNLKEYADWTGTTAVYPAGAKIIYPALGIINEAGEFVGKVKKQLRGDRMMTADELLSELGDVLWYTVRTMQDAGVVIPAHVLLEFDNETKEFMVDPNFITVQAVIMAQFTGDVAALLEHAALQPDKINAEGMENVCAGIIACIAIACAALGSSIEDLISRNVAKLESRKARDVIKGDGDNR